MSFLAKAARLLNRAKQSLGEDMVYRYKDGGSVSIKAIFNNQFEIVDPNTETMVTSNDPHIGVVLSDLSKKPREGDEVDFLDVVYQVVDVQEDGQGAAQIFLYKSE